MPKVSVIVPTYNRAELIGPTIESILKQTFADFELIVVNDGSTDRTEEVIKKYTDPRIKYFKKENGGQTTARNLGIKHSFSPYISYCDHDDIFHPNHLERLAAFLDAHKEIDLVYSNARIIAFGKYSRTTDFSHPRKDPEKDLFFVPMPSTMLHRRSALDKTGLWDEHRLIRLGGEDWDFWLRVKDSGCRIAHLPEVLTDYTIHELNMNSGKVRPIPLILTRIYVFKKRYRERRKQLGFLMAAIKSIPEWLRILG